jgi:hypothetical protein
MPLQLWDKYEELQSLYYDIAGYGQSLTFTHLGNRIPFAVSMSTLRVVRASFEPRDILPIRIIGKIRQSADFVGNGSELNNILYLLVEFSS